MKRTTPKALMNFDKATMERTLEIAEELLTICGLLGAQESPLVEA